MELENLIKELEDAECSLMCNPILTGESDYEIIWLVVDSNDKHIGHAHSAVAALKDAFKR
jgi:hypothetical protein